MISRYPFASIKPGRKAVNLLNLYMKPCTVEKNVKPKNMSARPGMTVNIKPKLTVARTIGYAACVVTAISDNVSMSPVKKRTNLVTTCDYAHLTVNHTIN